MRIFNNKTSNLELPLGNGQTIQVLPHGVSKDFLPSTNFLNLIVSTFDYDDISLIVTGVQEMNACSAISACNGFVVYSVSEAVERLEKIQKKKNPAKVSPEIVEQKEKEVKEFKKKKEKVTEKTTESENPSNS